MHNRHIDRTYDGVRQLPTSEARLARLDSVAAGVAAGTGRSLVSLEIGSLDGKASTRVLARYGTVWCVDIWPWGIADFFENTAGLDVIAVRGNSQVVLPRLARAAFDVVYVDGDHRYPAVLADMQQAAELVRPGGVACGDDLERQIGIDVREEDAILACAVDYVDGYHPGVSRAVREVFGGVSVSNGFWWKEQGR
jgi:predicted O-methyltransferase YrrM